MSTYAVTPEDLKADLGKIAEALAVLGQVARRDWMHAAAAIIRRVADVPEAVAFLAWILSHADIQALADTWLENVRSEHAEHS